MNQVSTKNKIIFFISACLIVIFSNIAFVINDLPLLTAFPLLIIFLLLTVTNYSILFYGLVASLPISFDIGIGSFTLSTPSEPLMIASLGVFVLLLTINHKLFETEFFKHSLITLLFLHYVVFILNIFISVNPFLSFKYLLAKTWFFAGFIFLPSILVKKEAGFKKIFWCFYIPLMFTVLYTIVRHALTAFGFEEINAAAKPFYANHVIYACTLGLALPFAVYAIGWYKHKPLLYFGLIASVVLLLFAILTSYTRTTWIAVVALIPALFIFRSNYFKHTLMIGLLAIVGFCYYLSHNNKYMDYAPNYYKTVFNKEDFNKHLKATVALEDVSGMERVYRWVAAVDMIKHNFFTGTGNNTFYPEYKKYANPAFITYLSHNPEGSSTHNYFLMIFSEQGVFGFLLFSALYIWALICCYHIFRRSRDTFIRNAVTACFLSLILFLVHLVLGDMVEVDKNGGIFFLILMFIIRLDLMNRKNNKSSIA